LLQFFGGLIMGAVLEIFGPVILLEGGNFFPALKNRMPPQILPNKSALIFSRQGNQE
jgi:hypothetical protein